MATASTTELVPQHRTGGALAPRLLIADDQPFILEALTLLLRPEGFQVETARTPALARGEEGASDITVRGPNSNSAAGPTCAPTNSDPAVG